MGKIKKFLIDIDGVLYDGDNAIDGAKETLEYLDKNNFEYALVTNTTRLSKQKIIEKLKGFGFKVNERNFSTSTSITIDYIKSKKENAKCYLITPDHIEDSFKDAGLITTRKEEHVDFVVLGYDTRTNYNMIDIAFRLIKDGAEFVAIHEDKSFPDNVLRVSLGIFVKGLEYCTDKKPTLIGKPNKKFFEMSMKIISAKAEETAMIGDSLSGDIIGAKNAGLKAIMVKTGNFNKSKLNESKIKPDYLIDSIKDLPNLLKQHC